MSALGEIVTEDGQLGFVYKITNIIQQNPDHPLYNELESHDTDYGGQSFLANVNKRYPRGIVETHNKHLAAAYEKFGIENFRIETLEEGIPVVDLLRRENFWLKELNCVYPNGYNIKEGSDIDNFYPPKFIKSVTLRNLTTNKIFLVDNLKEFCRKPDSFDPDWDQKPLNYQQLSNTCTSWISPYDLKRGQDKYPTRLQSGNYCLAKYTSEDIESMNRYKKTIHRRSWVNKLEDKLSPRLPITLLNLATLGQFTLNTYPDVLDFLSENNVKPSWLSRLIYADNQAEDYPSGKILKISNGWMLKENFDEKIQYSVSFWKYDNFGNTFPIELIKPDKGKVTINSNDIASFSEKYCRGSKIDSASLRRSLNRLISGELNIANGFKINPAQKLPNRLHLIRVLNNKHVRHLQRAGLLKGFKLDPFYR